MSANSFDLKRKGDKLPFCHQVRNKMKESRKNEERDFFYISIQIHEQSLYKRFLEEKNIKKASQVRFIIRSSIPFCRHGC